MVDIILIVGLLLAFVTGFFVAIKSVSLGLKWQIQTKEGIQPELHSPIAPIIETVQQGKVDKANKYSTEQVTEWMFGEGK